MGPAISKENFEVDKDVADMFDEKYVELKPDSHEKYLVDTGKMVYENLISYGVPTKNIERIEWMVEKCVEIGINEISFLQTRYSERKEIKIARIEKIAVGAMKQSLKAFLPKINEMISWKEFLKRDYSENSKMIAHLEEGNRKLIQQIAEPKSKYAILIGPEGDFSPKEIQLALENKFIPISLGDTRLRTETAAIVACHSVVLLNE